MARKWAELKIGGFYMSDQSEYIYQGFAMNFPLIAEETQEYHQNGANTIIVTLSDGTSLEYNDFRHTIMNVRDYDMSEESWKREFSNRLLNRMEEVGIDQSGLAIEADVSQCSISNYLRGSSIPTGLTIQKLSRALQCSPSSLMDFDRD